MESLQPLLEWIVDFVDSLGYLGIFIMTFIESTFLPVPAEFTMVPAGYLVQQGKMNGWLVMIAAILGTIGGSLANYWIALKFGRVLLEKYGKYVLMTPKKIKKMEDFFEKHGAISTFTGRLLPGLRHYISFPAGLAKMRLAPFCFYTGLGGGIWMFILMILGYFIGEEKELLKKYLPWIVWGLIVAVAAGGALYVYILKRKARKLLK